MSGKLEQFERFANLLSRWLNWVAIAGLIAMSLITVVDVLGAKLFRMPLLWSFEATALLGLVVLVFALAFTQFNRGHIEIEFVSARLPIRVQKVMGAVVALVGMALFTVMIWQMLDFAIILQKTNRVTAMQEIPMPIFAYGAAFCFLAIFLVLLLQFFRAVAEAARK